MATNNIYLLSSNSRKEYLVDSFETIALPYGYVQHYRYALKYVDDDLRELLKYEGDEIDEKIRESTIIVCILYQDRRTNNLIWEKIVPIRKASLISVFKTGNNDDAVAHFYFELKNLVLPSKSFDFDFKKYMASKYEKTYAILTDNKNFVDESNNKNDIFPSICQSIDKIGFRDDNYNIYEKPLFLEIKGLKKEKFIFEKKEIVSTKVNRNTNKCYYRISEGRFYSLNINTYNQDNEEYKILLKCDSKSFSSLGEYEILINAKYDRASFDIVPSILNKTVKTRVILEIKSNKDGLNETKSVKELNICIPIDIEIKKWRIESVINYVSDILLISMPTILGLSKVIEITRYWPNWLMPWDHLIFYLLGAWISFKLVNISIYFLKK